MQPERLVIGLFYHATHGNCFRFPNLSSDTTCESAWSSSLTVGLISYIGPASPQVQLKPQLQILGLNKPKDGLMGEYNLHMLSHDPPSSIINVGLNPTIASDM